MSTRKATVTDEHREEARRLREIWDSVQHETQAVFGEKYEIGNQSSVGQFLAGKVPLSLKAAQGFAKGLRCDVADFSPRVAQQIHTLVSSLQSAQAMVLRTRAAGFEGFDEWEDVPLTPVVGRDAAGSLPAVIWKNSGGSPEGATGEFFSLGPPAHRSFVAEVTGLNMIPRFKPGEYMLVEPNISPDIEDDVLVQTTAGRTLLRRLASSPDAEHVQLTNYHDSSVLTIPQLDIAWIYYVSHPLPRRKLIRR